GKSSSSITAPLPWKAKSARVPPSLSPCLAPLDASTRSPTDDRCTKILLAGRGRTPKGVDPIGAAGVDNQQSIPKEQTSSFPTSRHSERSNGVACSFRRRSPSHPEPHAKRCRLHLHSMTPLLPPQSAVILRPQPKHPPA